MRFANRLGLSRYAWVFICSLQAVSSTGATPVFYRGSAGAEIDLLLTWPNGEHWAIEVKRSTTPKVERGFHSACDDIKPVKKRVIYPGERQSLREAPELSFIKPEELSASVSVG